MSQKWTGNALSIPAVACSQQLLRRNRVSTGCYFFACLVFSPLHMNVFVTDCIIDNVVTHMQGFSSRILIILFVRNCVKCEGIWINMQLIYMVNVQYFVQDLHRFQIGFLKMSQFTVISPTIWFILWNATFHAVLCSCTSTVHVGLCAVGLQWHKMNRKCPDQPSSSLLTTAAERNKLPTGCYFFSFFVFSGHDMNLFVTDLTVDNVVTHVQGFSSGILIILFEKLCVPCEGIWINVWLPCMVNM